MKLIDSKLFSNEMGQNLKFIFVCVFDFGPANVEKVARQRPEPHLFGGFRLCSVQTPELVVAVLQ